ncbi:DUF3426 domain-containing protein [Pseudomaricurvus sp.]|uniref:DUF3426 domain-containing protein n=1 Tax=Pseudomaricurvus sp. TaxID=2004510 RepID=UPI003F6C03C3
MADRVTCCPHCSTSFRITDAQLQTAKGAVRCGSCLQIFRAKEHLLPLPEEQNTPSNEPSETAANPASEPESQPEKSENEPVAHEEPESVSETEPASAKESIFSSDEDDSDLDISSANYNHSLFDDENSTDTSDEDDLTDDFDLEDDMLISDDMNQDKAATGFSLGELSDDFRGGDSSSSAKSSLFDRKQKKAKTLESEASDDESWAEQLLHEMESDVDSAPSDPAPYEEQPATEQEAESDFFKSFGDQALDDLGGDLSGQSTLDSESSDPLLTDTSKTQDYHSGEYDRISTGSFNALDDDTLDSELGESFSSRREPLFSVTGERDTTDDADSENADDRETQNDTPPDYALDEAYQDEPQQSEHDLLLHGIAPAPVEMDWHVEKSPWPKRLLWGSLSLLACLGIVTQLAYFKFDEYSRTEPWRQGYAAICPMLGCSLPSLSDPRRVKAYNLVVRSNPETPGTLIIDSILLNTANFEQPFPDFALTFSNLQGKQVAFRRFTPKEYLGGELAGATRMPSGQPVHISLEVVDPGPDAVNYTATIPSH